MAALPTNYKEDIFQGNRKYQIVENGDGTVSFIDVTEYSQEGDTFGAAQINEIDTKLNAHDASINSHTSSISSLNSSMSTANTNITNLGRQLRSAGASGTNFYFDYKNGKYGWNSSSARGADTFHPFKSAIPTPLYWSPEFEDRGGSASGNSTTYTVPETGLYYLYASIATHVDDTHSSSVSAKVSLNDTVLINASGSRAGRRSDGEIICAEASATANLSAGQVLTLDVNTDGFGISRWQNGAMIIIVYSGA